MSTGDWIFVAGVIVAIPLAFLFMRWSRNNLYREGRIAYGMGLRRNPHWGKDILRGYDDAAHEAAPRPHVRKD